MHSVRTMQKHDGRKMCRICRKYIKLGEAIERFSCLAKWVTYKHVACIEQKEREQSS